MMMITMVMLMMMLNWRKHPAWVTRTMPCWHVVSEARKAEVVALRRSCRARIQAQVEEWWARRWICGFQSYDPSFLGFWGSLHEQLRRMRARSTSSPVGPRHGQFGTYEMVRPRGRKTVKVVVPKQVVGKSAPLAHTTVALRKNHSVWCGEGMNQPLALSACESGFSEKEVAVPKQVVGKSAPLAHTTVALRKNHSVWCGEGMNQPLALSACESGFSEKEVDVKMRLAEA